MTMSDLNNFCNQVHATLLSEFEGYTLQNLESDLFSDYQINPNEQAQKFGFNSLKDLLGSEIMRNRVTIEGRIYKAIPEEKYRHIYEAQKRAAREREKVQNRKERSNRRNFGVPPERDNGNVDRDNDADFCCQGSSPPHTRQYPSYGQEQSNTLNRNDQRKNDRNVLQSSQPCAHPKPKPMQSQLHRRLYIPGKGEPEGLDDFYDEELVEDYPDPALKENGTNGKQNGHIPSNEPLRQTPTTTIAPKVNGNGGPACSSQPNNTFNFNGRCLMEDLKKLPKEEQDKILGRMQKFDVPQIQTKQEYQTSEQSAAMPPTNTNGIASAKPTGQSSGTSSIWEEESEGGDDENAGEGEEGEEDDYQTVVGDQDDIGIGLHPAARQRMSISSSSSDDGMDMLTPVATPAGPPVAEALLIDLGEREPNNNITPALTNTPSLASSLPHFEINADKATQLDADPFAPTARIRLVPSESVLLVCDLQERAGQRIKYFPQIVQTTRRMVEAAKLLGISILATGQRLGGPLVPESGLQRPGTRIFEKTKFSMCIPSLCQEIGARIKSVIICGIEAHCGVYQTALDFKDRGFNVHVILDGTSSSTMMDRIYAYKQLERAGINLSTSECVILGLVGDSAHEKFKAVQKIIKDSATDTDAGLLTHFPLI